MEKEIRNITIVEDRARNIRLRYGLTQKEFGDILGISKSYVSDIENGYTGISILYINKICNKYSVSFDYMLGFCEEINKEIRKELGITQDKLACKLNISRPLVTHYEKGIRTISTADLKGFCELSEVSADYIVGKLNYKEKIKVNKKIKPKELMKV